MDGLEFPTGSDLIVERAAARDPFGDATGGGWIDSHVIGPCDVPQTSSDSDAKGETRKTITVDVRAPAGSDIRKSDRVRLPNGLRAVVTSQPHTPRNPFTGWAPFTHFTIKAVT